VDKIDIPPNQIYEEETDNPISERRLLMMLKQVREVETYPSRR
jgi:hypothetical protein